MSTASTIRTWSTTDASNASADSNISSSDSQSPDTLDNNIRSVMAAVRKESDDRGGKSAAGGTGNAITLTTASGLESSHIAAGLTLTFRATATNTGAVTFAPDSLTAVAVVDQFGAALAAGAITSGGIYTVTYNANTSKWVLQTPAVLPAAALTAGAMVLLTSGTVSSASTLDIVLTSYTGYRALKFVLTKFMTSTDSDTLSIQFSTDGGSNYDAGTSDYGYTTLFQTDSTTTVAGGYARTTAISLATPVGNDAAEGADVEFTLFDYENTARWTRMEFMTVMISSSATPNLTRIAGSGARRAAQNTDAVRIAYASGTIASGAYAVYGLR